MVRVAGDICGVQAQLSSAAELALWARVEGIRREDVQYGLWKEKTLIKTWCMRGTLHLLPAKEFATYVRVLRETRTGYRKGAWLRAFKITLEEIDRIIEVIGIALDRQNLTREELASIVSKTLGPHLRQSMLSGWGEFLKPVSYNGKLILGPTRDGKATFVGPDHWLETKLKEADFEESARRILRQYLGAYGPASPADFARWWGIDVAPARRLFSLIEGETEQVNVEGYAATILKKDLDKILRLPTISPVRLLPSFDPYLLHFRPREIIVPEKYLNLVFRDQAWIMPVVLVDGKVSGIWEITKKSPPELRIKLFNRLTTIQKRELELEADGLGKFLGRTLSMHTQTS